MTPPILHRVTTEFSPEEDRIRVAGSVADGQPVVVWLTRRMLGLLLPVLLQHLEQQFTGASPEQRDALQEFAQQSASEALGASEPVTAGHDAATILARDVDVTRNEGTVTMVFRNAAGVSCCLPFSDENLRQWMQILYRAERAAQWQLTQWPVWLTGERAADSKPAYTFH